ncbi:MAG TPA: hypothetical protein VFZ16_11010 [Hyphomicrobiaceae bacterium]|nr:hypothetical protein [Hyphomicrobiaceae bacterium]
MIGPAARTLASAVAGLLRWSSLVKSKPEHWGLFLPGCQAVRHPRSMGATTLSLRDGPVETLLKWAVILALLIVWGSVNHHLPQFDKAFWSD